MKKIIAMAALVLSSVGAFAQNAAGTTTIQPKVGLNVSTIGETIGKQVSLVVQNYSIRLQINSALQVVFSTQCKV